MHGRVATSGALLSCLARLAGLAACAVACGAAGASFDGNVYRKGPIAFRVPDPPAGWRRIDVSDATLAYRDEGSGGSILLNARCLSADDRTPLVALTNHLLIGATEREYVAQQAEPFDGREALHTRVRAKWDGVPMGIDIYVLSKDGCVYDFVFLGPPASLDTAAPAFESFVHGFRTLPGSGVVS
jgi:hypothetical protein